MHALTLVTFQQKSFLCSPTVRLLQAIVAESTGTAYGSLSLAFLKVTGGPAQSSVWKDISALLGVAAVGNADAAYHEPGSVWGEVGVAFPHFPIPPRKVNWRLPGFLPLDLNANRCADASKQRR